jgi:hypothetical protein
MTDVYRGTDPTRPSYIVRVDGHPYETTQDPERAVDYARDHVAKLVRIDHELRGRAVARVRIETVPAEWPDAARCRRADPHGAHTWGGAGYSPFHCDGVPYAQEA